MEGITSYIFGKSGLRKYRKLQRSSSLPGPGSYYNEINESFSSNLMNSASIIIGHEKKFLNRYKDKTSGPGEYEISGLIIKNGMLCNSKYI